MAATHSLLIELDAACIELGITTEAFEQYFTDELKYLDGLKEQAPSTTLKMQYV